jgi:hypothetical protein
MTPTLSAHQRALDALVARIPVTFVAGNSTWTVSGFDRNFSSQRDIAVVNIMMTNLQDGDFRLQISSFEDRARIDAHLQEVASNPNVQLEVIPDALSDFPANSYFAFEEDGCGIIWSQGMFYFSIATLNCNTSTIDALTELARWVHDTLLMP